MYRWEDVRAALFSGRADEIAEAEDRLRLAVTRQDMLDEQDLQAWERDLDESA